ncbi:hypothetical protein PR202_ga21880 [Eleusine coracana subsp. coracana]|uniref:VWFA domain-containing protein n=1 Tax=Eleusine coracana subsp. coracana TaxID=191504 RepID=A0AAV5D0R6_ELECO|nr:hypothetical protein PR202_ga21880 [Eleusine coracana subsp. coracana]
MSDVAKFDLKGIIDGLVARGGTNIQGSLETGLHVLSDRQFTDGHTANVLLMSNGEQNHGDARQVTNPQNVPVYSLAFGADADMNLLRDLATTGGTFNPVPDKGNTGMLAVFSQLMAGLLTVIDRAGSVPHPHYGKALVRRVPRCLPCSLCRTHGKHMMCRVYS